MKDKKISKLINLEKKRQQETLGLIASENVVSNDVLAALGSVFTNKYAEGYPGKRYYKGNETVDNLERLVQKRALNLYKLDENKWSVNVQANSGSPANLAVYEALIPPGCKIMGLSLAMGGHLTHGHKTSITGDRWEQIPYHLDENGYLDYTEIERIAIEHKPNMIITGYTAYSRFIDFAKFRKIADKVGALLMVDMSHIAGLIAAEEYPSPFKYADVVTGTTHKSLRGPRAALIFAKNECIGKINKAVFPGLQGGPHMNTIAAIGIALKEASTKKFKKSIKNAIENAKELSTQLKDMGWPIISDGTDTHVFLMNVSRYGIGGQEASDELEEVGIVVNKNMIPFDERTVTNPSGIRLGTLIITARGMTVTSMPHLAELIDACLRKGDLKEIKKEVLALTKKFPLWAD